MGIKNDCAAIVQLGCFTEYFEGYDFFDILNKMIDYQDFNCLCRQARAVGNAKDAKTADRMENWLYNFKGSPGDMHRFDDMDFSFSIGDIKCLEWAQGEENCNALREKFKAR